MGKPTTGSDDLAFAPVFGALTAATNGDTFMPAGAGRGFNVSVWGTFVGSVRPCRSFDGGTTWLPLTYADGTIISWTVPATMSFVEHERGVLYRVNCTAFTSGTINWRLSQ
jgi:hypothetical protein